MVVGAGRGPIVRAAINAAASAQRLIKVYAIEKNENVWNTLNYFKEKEWPPIVTIVTADMRNWYKIKMKQNFLCIYLSIYNLYHILYFFYLGMLRRKQV